MMIQRSIIPYSHYLEVCTLVKVLSTVKNFKQKLHTSTDDGIASQQCHYRISDKRVDI